MVYLFIGTEKTLKRNALLKLKAQICPEEAKLNYEEFSVEEMNIRKLVEDAGTMPFMAKQRLFVINDIDKLSEPDKESLVVFMKNKPESTVLALTADRLKVSDPIAKAAGKIMSFDDMQPVRLTMQTRQLIDAIISKNASCALSNLQSLGRDRRTISMVIGLIGWNLRKIWHAKKNKELEKGFRLLLKLDKDIKSKPIDAYQALELLVIKLCA